MPADRALHEALQRAIDRRADLHTDPATTCYRLFHGHADAIPGLFIDRYARGVTLILHLGTPGLPDDPRHWADAILTALEPLGVRAVYSKPFVRDRSRLSGDADETLSNPEPIAGEPLPEFVLVREHAVALEARLYDGFSTGLFLDQRPARRRLAELVRERCARRILNTFCYTGAFSVCCALAGASTTSVDVSPRALDWAKRNFAHNALNNESHNFARMGTLEFLAMAARKELRFDLIILDPPTFGAADKRRRVAAWSAERDYPDLLRAAADLLDPEGPALLYCSTNTRALGEPGRFEALIRRALPDAALLPLPPDAADFPPGEPSSARVLLTPAGSGPKRRC